jgi:hypothetical protein
MCFLRGEKRLKKEKKIKKGKEKKNKRKKEEKQHTRTPIVSVESPFKKSQHGM